MKRTATRLRQGLLASALLALAGCSLLAPAPSAPVAVAAIETPEGIRIEHGQFQFALPSGLYHCDEGHQLHIQRELDEQARQRIALQWRGSNYLLLRNPSSSGLPRFEDHQHGLVWIDLPWKGVLLNGRNHAPIASDCQAA